MRVSVSEQSFYINESDDEDLENIEEDGEESDSSNISDDNQRRNKENSMSNAWPQSYRQSIDLYSSVQSPNIQYLATTSLSRLGSSFLSPSMLTRRHTQEVLPTITKPFIAPREDLIPEKKHRKSSSYSIQRKSSLRKGSFVCHELPISSQCSYSQAVLNGMNVLCGVGILSTPFAVKQGGWASLAILFIFAILSFYTGILLRYCLDSQPGLATYPDIGQAAFGNSGRFAISIILYAELYASCVEYIILESDNLSSLFPDAHLNVGGIHIDSHHLFGVLATLTILPTVWLKDLRVLSYISAGGVVASVLVVLSLFWVGLVDKVGFESKGSTLNLSTLPVAIGLYGFCYSGHAVFPNIYTSMENRSQFPSVLLTSFGLCTLMYAGVAVMGYMMFGESTLSQFTLNMPTELVASKIAVWTTVVNPFTKYALTMTPVSLCLEELIPSHLTSPLYSILIRTSLVVSTLLVGLAIPFFGLVLSLIGSLLTMLVTFILPCVCYLSIVKGKTTKLQISLCVLVVSVGVVASGFGTYSALSQIIEKLG